MIFPTYVSLSPSGLSPFKLISVTTGKDINGEVQESAEYYNELTDIVVKTEFNSGRLIVTSSDSQSENLIGSQLFQVTEDTYLQGMK